MRIVSLAPSNTEILYALGVEDQVVAVTRFCDWPLEAKNKVQIGGWINTDAERLKELAPDLILTSYFMPEPLREWTGPGKLLHVEPKNLWDVFESIRTIGEAVGAPERAEAIVARMKDGFARLEPTAPKRAVRVYMEEWMEPPMASGNWVPELVAIAGGEEVLAEVGQASHDFPLAALTVADPDLIVCHWCGWGERTDNKRIVERPGWQDIRAIRDKQVYFVHDSLLNRPGPRLLEGALILQRLFNSVVANTKVP